MLARLFGKRSKPSDQARRRLQVAERDRIYAVGDIHGRADLLDRLLARIEADMSKRRDDGRNVKLVFLGDYVDRGDRSRDVLARLTAVDAALPDGAAIFLCGNHEAALLRFLEDPTGGAAWLGFGGRQTVVSYGVTVSRMPDETELRDVAERLSEAMGPHRRFLESRLSLWHRSGDVVFCHAGVDPDRTLDAQSTDALLWGASDFLERGGPHGVFVVHGHYDAPEVVRTRDRVCVDTGAYYSGRLTALRLDEDEALLAT